ncbi:DJ-1 family glyoxalase III [Lachnobacterium bovis]|uniref:4-methyl-5(B-hydroxyethyl)-thiazole monophosphate biosynthesis n=1 Tax=Lachnobacterium bovis TaxID=140626 RepID=A0A1H9U2D3_9FIRM|nr:DJ-1 family glyoxalase III [Lachnobacterium bovis]SES03401.1 4-methyl-5(b-hydroxyethyl)-thiazole monophosphate biosynthesis [Lachnobacterium bovis]
MSKVGIFMANGCEEIEGLTVVDLLRRASIDVEMIAIGDSKTIEGSHGIKFEADKLKTEIDIDSFDGVVLPGGMPGTKNLEADEFVQETLKKFNEEKKLIAAICAAPSVLGGLELLKGKKATSYPGFDMKMPGALYSEENVVVDGNIITSRGVGTAIEFALEITKYFADEQTKINLAESIVFQAV